MDTGADEAELRSTLSRDAGDDDARLALATLLMARGDQTGADTVLTELGGSGETREDVRARLGRIAVLMRLGRASEAQTELDALPPAARATPSARMSAARLALATERPEDAVRELAPLANAAGAAAPLLALYARALLEAGHVGEASNAYAASIERDAGLPEALFGRAEMAVRSRRPADATRMLGRLERALEQAPRPPAFHARVLFLRGRAQLMAGERADARRTLHRVAAGPGAPAAAYFYLAEAYTGHDSREAAVHYRRYLELEPEGHYARRARRALGISTPEDLARRAD